VSSSVTATFVFTDLVDSTATAARLGPDAAEDLRQTHFRLLRGAVAASGGVEVKNLGDGLMVMYSSPSRALAGVVGMQQAIEHHNRAGDEPLLVRIGVSAGEAVEEDGDYFGGPVVEAARLCAAAEAGQILAAQLVQLMVGRHATQTFVQLGPLDLKGIPDPVEAVEVLWEPATGEGSVPLPGRLVGAASDALFGFFGRGHELAIFEETRKRSHSMRRCQLVFVAGEAGMGKTALVAQAARAAHEQGAVVLFGHSDEDLGVAYQPWIEAVSTLVRDGDTEFVGDLRPAQRAALSRVVPDVGDDGPRVDDPDMERLLLLEATVALLAAASTRSPVLLVLDDLHWADAASLQLLRHVGTSTTELDLVVACTYRDTDLRRGDALSKLLADLYRDANITRVPLSGLDGDELVELMAAAAGHDLDDRGIGLAHAVRRETDGNPFFTTEMLRHLSESGSIALGEDGRWTVDGELDELGLPTSVRDVVGRRVERLGDEARRVLCLAAVIGRDFDVGVLTQLADIDEGSLLDLMDTAVTAAVLVESDVAERYRFAHALIQHALYDELSATRRQRAHQRIAEAIEGRNATKDAGTLAELARHWVAATKPAELDKAIDYVRRAGDAARDALAPEDAIRWYQQALDLVDRQATPDALRRGQLLSALGKVQHQAGYAEYRESLLQAADVAERLDDSDLLVDAALGFFLAETQVGDEDMKRVVALACKRIGTDATPMRARLVAALSVAHDAALEWQARRDLALDAVEAARKSDDDRTFAEVMNKTGITLAMPDRLAQNFADVEDAVTAADRVGDPVLGAFTRFYLVRDRYRQADLAGASEVIAEVEAIAEQVSLPYVQWLLVGLVAGQQLLAGRVEDAEVANERCLAIGTAANIPEATGAFGGSLYVIRSHQGRLDEIGEFFLDVAHDNPSITPLRAAVPALLCELGRVDEAREKLDAEAATGFDFPFDGLWLLAMKNLLEGAASTSDRGAARTLVDRVAPFASQVVTTSGMLIEGAIAQPLARAATVLGSYDQAEEWFAIAHDLHTRLQAPFLTALGQLDHADLCLARQADGDIERARKLVTAAAATAAEYGCGGLTRRADGLLANL
jgi:class 3 adenylate cyclase/tetratricopeptide (TPR) repeat protein